MTCVTYSQFTNNCNGLKSSIRCSKIGTRHKSFFKPLKFFFTLLNLFTVKSWLFSKSIQFFKIIYRNSEKQSRNRTVRIHFLFAHSLERCQTGANKSGHEQANVVRFWSSEVPCSYFLNMEFNLELKIENLSKWILLTSTCRVLLISAGDSNLKMSLCFYIWHLSVSSLWYRLGWSAV